MHYGRCRSVLRAWHCPGIQSEDVSTSAALILTFLFLAMLAAQWQYGCRCLSDHHFDFGDPLTENITLNLRGSFKCLFPLYNSWISSWRSCLLPNYTAAPLSFPVDLQGVLSCWRHCHAPWKSSWDKECLWYDALMLAVLLWKWISCASEGTHLLWFVVFCNICQENTHTCTTPLDSTCTGLAWFQTSGSLICSVLQVGFVLCSLKAVNQSER